VTDRLTFGLCTCVLKIQFLGEGIGFRKLSRTYKHTHVLLLRLITRGQKHLAKAVPNYPAHTARSVHCTRRRRFKPRDRQTDRQTPRTSVTIVSISCIRCSLIINRQNYQVVWSQLHRRWKPTHAIIPHCYAGGQKQNEYRNLSLPIGCEKGK